MPIRITIQVVGAVPPIQCEGETVVVSLHGALVRTPITLPLGASILITVYLTGKTAAARIVDVLEEDPLEAGIELHEPANIWGVPMPPDDWHRD